jgi:hypothetical protein
MNMVNPEDFDDEPVSPEHLNWQIQFGLSGSMLISAGELTDMLSDFLRSGLPLEQETRGAIADALQRGRADARIEETNEDGFPMPRLSLQGLALQGRLDKASKTRWKWLSAAQDLQEARAQGGKGDALTIEIGQRYELQFEAMKKDAIPFQRQFLAALSDPESALMVWAREATGLVGPLEQHEEDELHQVARARFVSVSALESVSRAKGVLDPD